jgi:N6-adenosine-specific RNA methylase IME4
MPYQTMTGIQLAGINVRSIAADGAQLWLWSPSRQIGDATLLMQLWGFSYAGLFIWKKPPTLGPWIRHDTEFLLRGVRKDARIKLPAPPQTHQWPRPKRHSEKPAQAYELIAEFSPGPRVDIFARQSRPGFEAWGNEPS